jgi:uncharacterized protein YbjT (DUF2867 family)
MPATYPSKPLRLLLVGATGAVGQQVLAAALTDPRVAEVVALTRRPLPPSPRLRSVVADMTALPAEADFWRVDAVICTLGTTMRAAGSQTAFAAVDRDLPVFVAQRARAAGATRFGLNSSLGALASSGNFYLRTKGEAEDLIRAIGYPSLTIVRPSLIDARRADSRPGERAGLVLARLLRPLIPARYRPVSAQSIATVLLDGVMAGRAGTAVIESGALPAGQIDVRQ